MKKEEIIEEISCGIVVFREENGEKIYLLLYYPGGHIDFPKGHHENEETFHETAIRELEEETGIKDIKIKKGYKETISYTYHRGNQKYSKKVVFFVGQTAQKEIKLSHEHKDYFWLMYKEALEKVTFENAKNILKKADKFLG